MNQTIDTIQKRTESPTRSRGAVSSLALPFALMLLGLFTSCRNDEMVLPTPETQSAIRFKTENTEPGNNHTRAAGHTLTGVNPILTMGVYAAFTSGNWSDSAPIDYMNNQMVSRNSVNQPWGYTPEQYWPGNGKISFFAYAPHSADGVMIAATTGIPSITFTVKPKQSEQIDLLVATPLLNQSKASSPEAITIPLKHSLTKIGFSARIGSLPAADTQIKIRKIEFFKFYATGRYPMDGTAKRWENLSDDNKVFKVENNGLVGEGEGGLSDKPLTEVYESISESNGHLFMLPQPLQADTKVTVTYDVIVNTTTETKSFDLKIADAIEQFKPSEAYNFLITIDHGAAIIVAPVNWDKMTVDADINNRILNIGRIEALVTDAAVTRIYFWSNQPKEAVKVEELLWQGTTIGGTGINVPVNSLYQTLSGQSDHSILNPSATQHIVYRGIDETEPFGGLNKGEGYLEIIHKDGLPPMGATYASPQVNHLFLNASGLIRSIRLSSINSPIYDFSTEKYIGTFHKASEIGERLVRWYIPEGKKWTAEVVTEDGFPAGTNTNAGDEQSDNRYADYREVRLDRWQSPAMEDGSIYGNNPSNPERGKVEGEPDSPQKVSGVGVIYFRVGWNTTAPTGRNRYAKVKVTVEDDPESPFCLFLRQGEMDDYVMRPTDNVTIEGLEGQPRSYAVKWSPYNLTDPGAGSSSQLLRRGAHFTNYPTQAGYLFQWGHTLQPRRAFQPHDYNNTLSNFGTTDQSTPFWNALATEHELCPVGYRRPVSGSISVAVGNHTASEFKQSFNDEEIFASEPVGNPSYPSNTYAGFYADGFFDRRETKQSDNQTDGTTMNCVSPSNHQVAYTGILYTNPRTLASLFLAAAGSRYPGAPVSQAGYEVRLWSASVYSNANEGWQFQHGKMTPTEKQHALSIRCVRDIPFISDLTDWEESYAPAILEYNAGDNTTTHINELFIDNTVAKMLIDIAALPSSLKHRIRARITFTGKTVAGNHVIATDGLSIYNHIAPLSTFTFAFTSADFTAGGTYLIHIPAGWEGVTTIGTTAPNWATAIQETNASPVISLNQQGTLVVRKK